MRLFTAVEIDEKSRTTIFRIQEHLKGSSIKGTFVKKENFHVTLKFLGETDVNYIERICRSMDSSVAGVNSFILKGGLPGYFRKKDGLIVWAGITEGSEYIWTIYSNLEDELVKAGFRKDTSLFTPHITLARKVKLRKSFDSFTENIRISDFRTEVRSVTLFESRMSRGIVFYEPLYRADLSDVLHGNKN